MFNAHVYSDERRTMIMMYPDLCGEGVHLAGLHLELRVLLRQYLVPLLDDQLQGVCPALHHTGLVQLVRGEG